MAEKKTKKSGKSGKTIKKKIDEKIADVKKSEKSKPEKSGTKQKSIKSKIFRKSSGKVRAEKIKEVAPVDDPYEVIRFVHMAEKSVRIIEMQNTLVFVVNRKFAKPEIAGAIKAAFGKEIMNVRTVIDQKGRKKAFVRFAEEGAAGDIAVRLGII